MACERMNKFAKLNNETVLKMDIKIPPKNKNFPRSAKSAAALNDTNTTLVPTNAVTTICGWTAMTWSNNGPNVCPDKKPKPNSIPSRV